LWNATSPPHPWDTRRPHWDTSRRCLSVCGRCSTALAGRDCGLGLPTTRTRSAHIAQTQEADRFHRSIGTPSRGRHRDPTVYTSIRHVTNTRPCVQCPWWNRCIGRPHEVHVRRRRNSGLAHATSASLHMSLANRPSSSSSRRSHDLSQRPLTHGDT
jgi:hypothetical protein